ncbi:MAG: hypothetical protein A2Y10_08915 [Planctomycetes bacterium GWF2_41_51]|nr:MAG: hypothetical protein A2Y10_08915 [Planctomycetes bacterium GWF2_41_51]HBG26216.1 hypothetical protein [Phycisphaerales bacterium]
MKTDTPKEVLEIQYELYRKMSPEKRIELVFDAYRTGQLLSMAGIKSQYPNANESEVWHIWAKRHLGEQLYKEAYGSVKNE